MLDLLKSFLFVNEFHNYKLFEDKITHWDFDSQLSIHIILSISILLHFYKLKIYRKLNFFDSVITFSIFYYRNFQDINTLFV